MALDVPFGNVRFIEVLQRGELTTDVWFDFLNLGYRIAPAAGSDAPYGARIGDVRSYAKLHGRDDPQGWFDGLARGATFATNGPIIEMELNGVGLGEEVACAPGEQLRLAASVTINPDIDGLDRVEIVEQGRVVKEVKSDGSATAIDISYDGARHRQHLVRRAGIRQDAEAGCGQRRCDHGTYICIRRRRQNVEARSSGGACTEDEE